MKRANVRVLGVTMLVGSLAFAVTSIDCASGSSTTGGTGGKSAGGMGGSSGGVGGSGSGTGGNVTAGTGGAIAGTGGGPVTGTGGNPAPGTGGATGSGTGGASGGGTGGSGGAAAFTCPAGGVLDCTSTGAITLMSGGDVSNFSTQEWNNTAGKWCDPSGLGGSLFGSPTPTTGDGGTVTGGAAAGDNTAHNLKLTLDVAAGGFANGGMAFNSCLNASSFNALQFSASISAGSLTGCTWQVQLQTQEQRRSTATNPSGGTCTAASCYAFPAAPIQTVPTATPTTITIPFSSFAPASVNPLPGQIIGIQWQVSSAGAADGGAQMGCDLVLRIDDVAFVTQ